MGHSVAPFPDYRSTAGPQSENHHFDVCFVGMQSARRLRARQLAHRIRNSKPNHEAIIVMLSAGDDVACRRKAFGEGVDLILNKPISARQRSPHMLEAFPNWKNKGRCAARLPLLTDVVCTSDGREFKARSLNISESGMLLEQSVAAEIGGEVTLIFPHPEIRASLDRSARIVRKENTQRVATEFIGLAPEDRNAIHLYVTGRSKDAKPTRDDLPPHGYPSHLRLLTRARSF